MNSPAAPVPATNASPDSPIDLLKDLSSQHWKSGIAARLGCFFDGLDMHHYTVVAIFLPELRDTAQPVGEPAE